MKALPALIAAVILVPALAADPAKEIAVEAKLEPGKIHENCLKLAKGKSKRFEWTSNVPVDFNIHYHKGETAYYPFKANNRKSAKAKFTADHADDYCWMWTALKDEAKISGVIR